MQNCGSSTLLRVGVWHPLRASQGSTFLPDDIYLWKTQTEGGQMASIKPNNTKKKARNSLLYSNNVLRRSLSNALRLSFNLVLLYSRNILKLFRPFMAIFSLSEEWKQKSFIWLEGTKPVVQMLMRASTVRTWTLMTRALIGWEAVFWVFWGQQSSVLSVLGCCYIARGGGAWR